ncbi:hypothetical protein EJ03DRAFT_352411 [Teratosphaeria nubilosa]|uniref:Uncharacterized protein n=1 Tax=Teratosphaeria nubilosa TaxID=161662 RepID=A0A6G1L5N4_9PEZI|nr:hypothetical protein EJ03DRAFT_352411 [Teratosphaeria nubilosa]
MSPYSTETPSLQKKTNWSAKDDRTLLLFARIRMCVIDAREYGTISKYLTCKPSSADVQERVEKRREEQISKLKDGGILEDKDLGEIQEARLEKHRTGVRAEKVVKAEEDKAKWAFADQRTASTSSLQTSSSIGEALGETVQRVIDEERAASKRL